MLPKTLLAICLCELLTGCALPGTISAPTPYPPGYLPTVIYLTAQSINATRSAGITPTDTPTAAPTLVLATPLPTVTPTPGPDFPLAAIQINAPGPMSRISTPLDVHMLAVAGDSRKIEVALFGEDGRVIGRTIRVVPGYPAGDPLSVKIPFEIRAAGENGVVQISTKDAHGRVESLNSVRVLLLSSGASQINPPGNMIYERVVFYKLPPDAHVSGGVLAVKGRFTPLNHKPVILELAGQDGKILVQRVLNFAGTDWQPFDTTMPYQVIEATAARLFIHQDDDVIDGPAYVYSQPITLNP
jgi:hypothetical protein